MILLATARHLPDLAPCERPLVPALRALGCEVEVAVWDDPAVDWAAASLVVIRTCWDYHLRLPEFLAWASAVPRLVNPFELVRWNAHKGYLRDLPAPTVPTAWFTAGEVVDPVALGWPEVVVKPAVSASAHRTVRTREAMVADDEVLVQPYLEAVEGYGERALVFVNGVYTHAVRKAPVLSGVGEAFERVDVTAAELALAHQTLAVFPVAPLYARVDVLGDYVMELEVIEPSLYLTSCPEAASALAAAIVSLPPPNAGEVPARAEGA